MVNIDVGTICKGKNFPVTGSSYIGAPKSNTAMFITKKVEQLLSALESVSECLVFAENGITVSDSLLQKHAFVFSKKPQLAYARFVRRFADERLEEEKKLKFQLIDGSYICEDTVIGNDAYIEPGCVIGPDVQIGQNARIHAGCVIKRTTAGDNLIANELSVIGANGFTMAEDEDGNKQRIPTLGRVTIGNNVEIGAQNNVSCGSGGDTILEDNVKLDALVHVGHDVHLRKNVEVTAGATLGGYLDAGKGSYIGIGSVIRNRVTLGDNAFVGMGSNVIKSVEPNVIVAGNPAKPFIKK